MRLPPAKNAVGERGFTLIELMIVVIVMGILAAIAVPNYMRMRKNSLRASCVANQRNVAQGAALYSVEKGVADTVINVKALQPGGYISLAASECPMSKVADRDDYTITIAGNRVTDITCTVEPSEHLWNGLD